MAARSVARLFPLRGARGAGALSAPGQLRSSTAARSFTPLACQQKPQLKGLLGARSDHLRNSGVLFGPASCSARLLAVPAEDKELEERVVKAVKRWLEIRKHDVQRDLEELDKNSEDAKKNLEFQKLLDGEVTVNSTWDQFGLDELDRVEVLLEVEEEFGEIIPDEVADNIQSAQEAVSYLITQRK